MNFFNQNSQGVSLLKARQKCIATKMEKFVEQQIKEPDTETGIKHIDLRSSLAISSYLLFGKPWKKIDA